VNWSALTKKQQQMVIVTVVLAVIQIFLLAHFLGWTRPSESAGVKQELRDLQKKLADAAQIISREAQIRSDLNGGVARLEELISYVPNPSDRYAWAYEYVSRRATLAGIEIDSLEQEPLSEIDKESPIKPYEISIITQCGFTALTDFLWRLEQDNPLLQIKEVTVSLIPDDPLRQQVKIIIQWPSAITVEKAGS
jgi:hypothetical protein